MIFATSCENELELGAAGEESMVSFTIATPDMGSRAYSDGYTATVLQYAVYDAAGNILNDLTDTKTINGSTTVNLKLTTGNSYSVIFWAAAPGAPYAVNFAEKTMTVNYQGALSNDENRDAFYKYHEFTVNGAQTEAIELRRPFAQLNIGTADYAASASAGYTPTQSAVTVKNVYKTLNFATGAVDGSTAVTFAENAIPAGEDFPVEGARYEYLAMNYLLVSADQELVEVEFTYTDGSNAKTRTVGSVPVQRNYRTNIYGNILTSDVDINVTIDPDYNDPANNVETIVYNATELQAALDAAEEGTTTIRLATDVEGEVTLAQKPNTAIVFDGGGNTFSGVLTIDGKSATITTAGFTVKNLNFTAPVSRAAASSDACIRLGDGTNATRYTCNVTVENCIFDATGLVGIKSYTGGDKNLTITNCKATENAHSLVQAKGIDGVVVKNCEVKSKNGMNFNNSDNVTAEKCTVDVRGYAVRFGESSGGTGAAETYLIKNCSLKSKNDDGDAVIILRGTADYSTLTIENTTIEGDPQITNTATDAKVIINGATAVFNAEGLKAALINDNTVIINADIENSTIKLPAELKNFTLVATKGATLKNCTISAADGNSYNYENLTFDGLTFDNSRILLTGWRNGEEVIKNLTITNCTFQNLDDTSNTAPVHINKDAAEAVENFTFTNNVIDGATGGSKSGVYAQLTGKVVFENNVINNVSFRPYVIQITTDDGIADTFTVKGNTFSGSSVGRAQGLGNNSVGTDAVQLVVSGNIFKDITDAQQICYWNFNAATTTADLSKNYYSIDIEANPSRIYYNAAASSVEDLKAMGIYPYYTKLNADGTIDLSSLKQAE